MPRNARRTSPPAAEPRAAWFDAWERLPPRRRHLLALGLLAAVAVWFLAPVLFGEGRLVGNDITQWSAMARSVLDEAEATGEKPLWAVNPFMGMPAYMISYDLVVPQVDDVARWLRMLVWPLSHLAILFAGTYGLVFFLTRDRLAGVVSGIAYGLTTYLPVLLVAGHHSKYVALSYVPWLLWAFAYALRRPSLLAGLLFGVAAAANLRAGHVQITYYAAFLMAVWWIVEAVDAWRHHGHRDFARATVWLAAGGLAALAMVAQPYLVQAEFKRFTVRGVAAGGAAGGMGWDYAMAWSQGVGELLTLVVSDAYGGAGSTYWGPKTFTGGPHYAGGIVLLLAGIALWLARNRTVVALAAAGVLMTLFSLGEHLPALNRLFFEHFPLFSSFRVPETWLSAVAFVLAVLAGIGVSEAVRVDREPSARKLRDRRVTWASVTAVAMMLLLVVFADSILTFEKAGEVETLAAQVERQRPDLDVRDPQVARFLSEEVASRRAGRAELFARDARRGLAFVVAAAVLLVLVRRRRLPGWTTVVGLALLVAADLGGVGHRYLSADALLKGRRAEDPVPQFAFDRFVMERAAEAGGAGRFRTLSLEGDPTVTARPAAFYESLGGYHGAKLRNFQDFLDRMLLGRGGLDVNALRLTNVRYVAASFALPQMEAVFVDDAQGMTVFEVPGALPRAWFVDSVEVVPDVEARWARLGDVRFAPARSAVVAADIGVAPSPPDTSGRVNVTVAEYRSDHMAFDVQTDRERLLVVSEVYYPAGWTAAVDGEARTIHAVDYLLRGIVVPAGTHRVELSFEPETHRIGVAVSAGSTALVYGALLWLLAGALRRRRAAG